MMWGDVLSIGDVSSTPSPFSENCRYQHWHDGISYAYVEQILIGPRDRKHLLKILP